MTFAAAIERIGNEIDLGNLTAYEVAELLDRDQILKALHRFGWNQCAVADALGIHRNMVKHRMDKHGIVRPEDFERKNVKRKPGRPSSPVGEIAKSLGIRTEGVRDNGLDREISPLVMKIRLNQMQRKERQRQGRKQKETENVDKMLAISERISALASLKQ